MLGHLGIIVFVVVEFVTHAYQIVSFLDHRHTSDVGALKQRSKKCITGYLSDGQSAFTPQRRAIGIKKCIGVFEVNDPTKNLQKPVSPNSLDVFSGVNLIIGFHKKRIEVGN